MIISIDGDNIGKKLERFILSEDYDSLRELTRNISTVIQDLNEIILLHKGNVYLSGGDNIIADVDIVGALAICEYLKLEPNNSSICFSIGIGETMKNTYMALKFAKALGAGSVVYATNTESAICFNTITNAKEEIAQLFWMTDK